MSMWGKYVPVHQRQAQAKKKIDKLRKKGAMIEPIKITGRAIANEFWGKKWCDHMEGFADYGNRLPRGRAYVRNGSVCHLQILEGKVEALVSGSSLYSVSIEIGTLAKDKWNEIKKRCSGLIGSILEMLQGKLSKHVMGIVADSKEGLFPSQKEISYRCSCPDWAGMCKHVAAVLYGIGSRLDHQPELLFRLRGVDPQELVSAQLNVEQASQENLLQAENLADLFDIHLEQVQPEQSPPVQVSSTKSKTPKKAKQKKATLDMDNLTGSSIRNFREVKRLTVAEFARLLDVTTASIYRWESTPGVLSLQSKPKQALIKIAGI